MIWFFLMGMVAGAVGMVMLANWWMHRRKKTIAIREKEEEKDNE